MHENMARHSTVSARSAHAAILRARLPIPTTAVPHVAMQVDDVSSSRPNNAFRYGSVIRTRERYSSSLVITIIVERSGANIACRQWPVHSQSGPALTPLLLFQLHAGGTLIRTGSCPGEGMAERGANFPTYLSCGKIFPKFEYYNIKFDRLPRQRGALEHRCHMDCARSEDS